MIFSLEKSADVGGHGCFGFSRNRTAFIGTGTGNFMVKSTNRIDLRQSCHSVSIICAGYAFDPAPSGNKAGLTSLHMNNYPSAVDARRGYAAADR
jgi:hypothetical protein